MTQLRCESLTTGYSRGSPVLKEVTAHFEPGITALIGPNGAGKSTLLRAILGTLPLWSGRILLDDTPISTMPTRIRARRVAYIAQRSTVSTAFNCREVVELGRFSNTHASDVVDRALHRTEISDLAEIPFHNLSMGQQQRVALARVLAQLDSSEADSVLLADEPVASMDPAHARHCFALLRELANAGTAVIIVLHDLTHAIRTSDYALLLDADGSVAAAGPSQHTLTPHTLRNVFSVPFDHAQLTHGPALIPAGADTIG